MSWLRSAVIRAVDVDHIRNVNISRLRSVAGSVLLQAGQVAAGGANLIQDHMGYRHVQSFREAVKRLEEISVSCRGGERVLLLRRWLVALKQVDNIMHNTISTSNIDKDKASDQPSNELGDESTPLNLVTYYDSDHGRDSLNFRDVFLHSQLLEGIILSMILEPPTEEETSLLLGIFRLCLLGGREAHTEIIRSIEDLAKVFSNYHDEVLMKREHLLQYAQDGIKGLKLNPDLARIDVEVLTLKTKLNPTNSERPSVADSDHDAKLSQPIGVTTIEALKEALSKIQLCSKVESLLLELKAVRTGDSPESHSQKVDKLKILLESLANSTVKAERRKSDHRSHKEEAVYFRLAKATEVSQSEKDLVAEIEVLEKQKDEHEVQLRKINTSLRSAKNRLRNAREERNQFDDASNEILQHLQSKEEEISKAISSFRAEAEVITRCVKLLEDSWGFQSSFARQKEKHVNDELEKVTKRHSDLVVDLLPAYEHELENMVTCFRVLVRRLKLSEKSANKVAHTDDESAVSAAVTRKGLEQEYKDLEAKLITAFNLVESMKQTFAQNEEIPRKKVQEVNEVFAALEKLKEEFELLHRSKPVFLTIDIPNLNPSPSPSPKQQLSWLKLTPTPSFRKTEPKTSSKKVIDAKNLLDSDDSSPEADVSQGNQTQKPEIIDWEFDAALDN